MASIYKVGNKYKAQVSRHGVRKTKSFATRQAAKDWAARQEYLIINSDQIATTQTFGAIRRQIQRPVLVMSPAIRRCHDPQRSNI